MCYEKVLSGICFLKKIFTIDAWARKNWELMQEVNIQEKTGQRNPCMIRPKGVCNVVKQGQEDQLGKEYYGGCVSHSCGKTIIINWEWEDVKQEMIIGVLQTFKAAKKNKVKKIYVCLRFFRIQQPGTICHLCWFNEKFICDICNKCNKPKDHHKKTPQQPTYMCMCNFIAT